MLSKAKIGKNLTKSQTAEVKLFLKKWEHIFSPYPYAPAKCKLPYFRIPTGNAQPVKENPRRYGPWRNKEIDRHVSVKN